MTDGRTNGRTDERKISPFYRTSSPIGAAAQKNRKMRPGQKRGDKMQDKKMGRQDKRKKNWELRSKTKNGE